MTTLYLIGPKQGAWKPALMTVNTRYVTQMLEKGYPVKVKNAETPTVLVDVDRQG